MQGVDRLPARVNYLIGNDPGKWRIGVPSYGRVKYSAIYPGIDLVYYGNQGTLEYDLALAPGVKPDTIRLGIEGADGVRINESGDLVMLVAGGEVRLRRPAIYQPGCNGGRRRVEGRYAVSPEGGRQGGRWVASVEVKGYDSSKPLIIDPQLVYGTVLGGNNGDHPFGIGVDSKGLIYVIGMTRSTDFTITPDAFQTKKPSFGAHRKKPGISYLTSVFVSVLDPAQTGGKQLVYSTYLGGSGCGKCFPNPIGDWAYGGTVDSNGLVYVTGFTMSKDFPVTRNALQRVHRGFINGATEGFVTVLNPFAVGTAQLVYSSYLGGSGIRHTADKRLLSNQQDSGEAIVVGPKGLTYITGFAVSKDFPVTGNAFQAARPPFTAAFVTVLDRTARGSAQLVYSTYLGASNGAEATGIALGPQGFIYVAGLAGKGLPVSANAFQRVTKAFGNGFVSVLNPKAPGAAQLFYSTYLGGSGAGPGTIDEATKIAVDHRGFAYVVGDTQSSDFPVTKSGLITSYPGGNTAGFVSVLNPAARKAKDSLVYSTFLGGSGLPEFGPLESGTIAIAADSNSLAYVTGATNSTSFPVTPNAFQQRIGGNSDAILTILDPGRSGKSSLVYSTYLGGKGSDTGFALALDSNDIVYMTGITSGVGSGFPVSPGAFQTDVKIGLTGDTIDGATGFVAVLDPSAPPPTATPALTPGPLGQPAALFPALSWFSKRWLW